MNSDKIKTNNSANTDLIEAQFRRLLSAAIKEFAFFGTMGFLLGLIHLSEFSLLATDPCTSRLSNDLLSDNLSFTALIFLTILCIFVGGVAGLSWRFPALQGVILGFYDHARERLVQLSSPMLCVALGLGAMSSIHFFCTGHGKGLALAAMLLWMCVLIVIAILSPALLDPRAHRPKLKDKQWVAAIVSVTISVILFIGLVYAIPAQHRVEAEREANLCNHSAT